MALGSGLLMGSIGLHVFAAVFLAEEIYGTGVVLLVLRHAGRQPPAW
jgi:hypothetical protein